MTLCSRHFLSVSHFCINIPYLLMLSVLAQAYHLSMVGVDLHGGQRIERYEHLRHDLDG